MGRDTLSVTSVVSVSNKDRDSVTVPVTESATEWVVEDDLLSVWVLVAVGGTLLEVVVVRVVVVGADTVVVGAEAEVVSVWDVDGEGDARVEEMVADSSDDSVGVLADGDPDTVGVVVDVCDSVNTDTDADTSTAVSYTHLRAHETPEHLVCRLLLEKKKKKNH
eukprot:TRINITY_DN22426_c0_g1_i1.p1 TRINITY_DN22426_c0_g1~~TRINITY_DN22426_c0_g1_i1.p1  ORF type:complete len:164 (-),score=28.69 TRINITY_DN22426_c0_g1_i1:112-603(-)